MVMSEKYTVVDLVNAEYETFDNKEDAIRLAKALLRELQIEEILVFCAWPSSVRVEFEDLS